MATNSFFQGAAIGAPGKNSVVYTPPPGGQSRLSQEALDQHRRGILTQPQQQEEEKQSSNSSNRNLNQNPTATTQPTASTPTGSNLVAGGPGTGMAASYAPTFGLQGAVSSGGLGSYAGGAGGLMTASGAGASGASFGSLGAASSGLTYGGATGAATTGAGAGSSFFGLGGASAGMTYGGATGAATAGASTASAGTMASAGGAGAGSMMSGLASNPYTLLAAAVVGTANYQHNKGITNWSDTIKGKAGGEMLDYYGGRADGKTHGFLGKIANDDKSVGKSIKGVTDFHELDWGNAWKNTWGSWKDLFSGDII